MMMRGRARRIPSVLTTFALAASALVATAALEVAAAPPAAAATGDYKVTFVARECAPTSDPGQNNYKLIRANRARNNIQETLKNLGPNTNYNDQMNPPVSPAKEDAPPQDACRPITNWPFTTGNSINGKAPAPLNYLSKVGGVNSVAGGYRTLASTPELDSHGLPTGRSIAGAVTVGLTDAQAALAGSSKFWVMGGTTTDPLGSVADGFGPANYAFGALRCAVDALNGDNVERADFRNGTTHVFCYAYYVTPPELNGQIIIRKAAAPVGSGGGESFGFQGDISYTPGGVFALKEGESFDERRSAGTWSVAETTLPTGWTLQGITCSTTGGASYQVNLVAKSISLTLVGNDSIDCTYTNKAPDPPGRLSITKITDGGVGTFGFGVTGPTSWTQAATITTTTPGVGVTLSQNGMQAGQYTMTETLPTVTGGSWALTSVTCFDALGAIVPVTGTGLSRTISLGSVDTECVWTNSFTPTATLIIRAKTYGGTAAAINYLTTGYDPVTGDCDPAVALYDQNADTSGDPNGSSWHVATGDSSAGVPVNTWCIGGTRPGGGSDPAWVARDITCTGDIDYGAPFNTSLSFVGAIVRALPGGTVTCDFTYVRRATVDVSKTITANNGFRTGPAVVVLDCPASRAFDPDSWPKTLTVATGDVSGTLSTQLGGTQYVDGDLTGSDVCTVTETATGAGGAGPTTTIAAFWNATPWWSTVTKTLGYRTSAGVAGTASNHHPVTVSVASGACTFAKGRLTAGATTGACLVRFAALGNPGAVSTATAWSSTIEGQGTQSGTGAGGQATARVVAPNEALAYAVTDGYSRVTPTVTATRHVNLTGAPQPPVCSPATSVQRYGRTVLFGCGQTSGGGEITWHASCRPRGVSALGDLSYCGIRVSATGRVTIRTYGYHLVITLTGRAPARGVYAAWRGVYRWYT